MTAIIEKANEEYRDKVSPGSSAEHWPEKPGIRELFAVIDIALGSLGVNGAITVKKATYALLAADLAHAADTLAVVYDDPTPANNGIYAKVGTSGSGSWSLTDLALPSSFATDLSYVLSRVQVVDDAVAATAADRVQTGIDAATATAARIDAVSAANQAIAAAEATGPTFFFDTLAAANAAIGTITANAVVEIFSDESRGGHLTRYRKESGVLVFKVDLTQPWFINQTITLTADTSYSVVQFGPNGKVVGGAFDLDVQEVIGAVGRVGIFDFSGAGRVTVGNGMVEAQWWGDVEDTLIFAHHALPASGGIIDVPAGRTKKNAFAYAALTANAVYMSKPNVWVRGKGMPSLTSDARSWVGGSIIEGTLLNYGPNFRQTDFACDFGQTFSAANGNIEGHGIANTYPSDELKDADSEILGGYMRNVGGLCVDEGTLFHAVIIAEGIRGVVTEGVVQGWYGSVTGVNKGAASRLGRLMFGLSGGGAIYIKTDDLAGSHSDDVEIETVDLYRDGPPGVTPYSVPVANPTAFVLNPEQGDINGVRVGRVNMFGTYANGIFPSVPGSGGGDVLGVKIGSAFADGVEIALSLSCPSGTVVEIAVEDLNVKNGLQGMVDALPIGSTIRVGKITAEGMSGVAAQFAGNGTTYSDTAVGEIIAKDCGSGAIRVNFDHKPAIGRITLLGSTPRTVATDGFGMAPALATGWTQVAGEEPFGVTYGGGRAGLRGRIQPGSANVPVGLPVFMRPLEDIVLMAPGNNAGTVTAVPVTIGANGNVTINALSGGYANAATWLSLNQLSWDVSS